MLNYRRTHEARRSCGRTINAVGTRSPSASRGCGDMGRWRCMPVRACDRNCTTRKARFRPPSRCSSGKSLTFPLANFLRCWERGQTVLEAPHLDQAVPAGAGKGLAVRTETYTRHGVTVALEQG